MHTPFARIPAGISTGKMLMTIDLLPTFVDLIGATLPQHTIDGMDVLPLIVGTPGAKNPHEAYWSYLANNEHQTVTTGDGRWKLVFPHKYSTLNGKSGGRDSFSVLFTASSHPLTGNQPQNLYAKKHSRSGHHDRLNATYLDPMKASTYASVSQASPMRRWLIACGAAAIGFLGAARGAEVDITPNSTTDGAYTQVSVAGQTAWQNTGTSRYLYARRPNSFAFTPGQTLYVRVTYFDDAGGTVDLQFDAQTSSTKTSTLTTRTTRVNSGLFVNGFFELSDVLFNKRMLGSSDFRIVSGTTDGAKVPVQRITLSDTPFANSDFQLAVSRAWQTRYTGPAKDYVDRSTLKGKVMSGYQGWFGTPNDIADTDRWKHWVGGSMISENFQIDAWPDLTEYDPASLIRAGDVLTESGAPAYLFSSRSYAAVQKHFRWMRKHNIDGAWLQRFQPKAGGESEWVLRNVSQAAAEEGLIWGVEYDVSGMADATVAAKLQADWEWLTTQFDILNDPRYVRENGKPVVFIWGLPVPDRNFTTASANAVVDYFKAQGAYVIGGLPTNWATLDAGWQTHMAKYDGVLVWQNQTPSDAALFRNRGQDFFPHVWPGFSWAHLKQLPATPLTQYTARSGGQFFWDKGRDWINASAGADRLFIGMFDEYDEATHVMPHTDDHPNPYTEWGRFIDNEGKPSDWWMMLTDELKRMMWGQRTNTGTLPTVASLSNRSNIGAEAAVDLGATDSLTSLSRVPAADGNTTVETVGGKECRGNTTLATDRYLYFNVNNSFAYQLVNGDVTIEVEYYDITGSTTLGLQYDGTGANYTTHSQSVTTTGSNTWRTVRFEIADAYFGGRQNGGSDFRLTFGGKKLNVNRVWVRLPEGKFYPFTWTNTTAGPALTWSQNANWLGGIVAQSDLTSTVRLFPGQTMPGGAISISNNLTGQQFGTLLLGGTAASSADTSVTISGNACSLGGSAPTITLDAMKTAFDLTYDIALPVTLLGTTQVSGTGNTTLRISGALNGTGGLTKTTAGTLVLSGNNIYTGTTTISAGTLQVGDGTNVGSIASTSVINNNAALVYNVGAGSRTLTAGISGNGSLTQASVGGTLILSGNNTYTGTTTISAGTLSMSANRIQNSPTIFIGNGATLGSGTLAGFTLAAGQTITGTGATGFVTTTSSTGLITAGNNTIGNNAGGTLNITRFAVQGANNTIPGGTISSGAAGTSRGLFVGNDATATLTITGGILSTLSDSGTNTSDLLGNGANGNATLMINGGSYTTSATGRLRLGNAGSNGSGTLTLTSGSATIANLDFTATSGSGTVDLDGGNLTLGALTVATSGGTKTFNFNGGALTATSALTFGNLTAVNVKNGGANINTNNNTVTISNALAPFAGNSTGGLTKIGLGTLILSGNNTYTGNTTITGGTLALGASNTLPTTALTLGNATLNAVTFTDTLGTLDVAGSAVINLGAGASLAFANSSAIDWSGGSLTLTGTFVSGSSLRFGTTSGGLTLAQLSQISAFGVYGFVLNESGFLTTIPPGFSSWITSTFAGGQLLTIQRGPTDDPDNDGIPNLLEYALAGEDPTIPNPIVSSLANNTLSFTKRASTNGLTYIIEVSTDIGITDPWAKAMGPGYTNTANTIAYTFTPGIPSRLYVRLKVTQAL
jgi:autotransporter-associated beta strand protein